MKKLVLLLLLLTLCACAKTAAPPLPPQEADAQWQKMAAFHGPGTWKTQFSLRFGTEGDTRRVTGLLWGDDGHIRLDIMAGVGAPIAKILAQGQDFLLYLPQKQVAYSHSGPTSPWFKLGVPIPLSLQKLAELMNGNFAAVFERTGPAKVDGDACIYPVGAPTAGELTLNAAARPVRWHAAKGGWTLVATYEGESREPQSLRLTNTNGKRAIILIKDRGVEPQFTAEQLALPIPPGTRQESLADLKEGGIQF